MSRRRAMRKAPLPLFAAAALLALIAPTAGAEALAVWKLRATSQPTHLIAGQGNEMMLLTATNVGAKATSGKITIADTLPGGVQADLSGTGPNVFTLSPGGGSFTCATAGQEVSCEGEGTVRPGYWLRASIPLEVTGSEGTAGTNEAEVSGGGAPAAAKVLTPVLISAALPSFDFFPGENGFKAPVIEEDGTPAVEAGSHPYESIVDLGLPTVAPGEIFTGAGHLRDVKFDLPPGFLADPAATPVRCTEAELTSQVPGCPNASQVGTVTITTVSIAALGPHTSPLYNMVPPPGTPASLGFDALGVGIFPHLLARLRTESDYGASGIARDILARGTNPVLDVSGELWGDPPAKAHDYIHCSPGGGASPPCEVEARPDAFLTLPTECSGEPIGFDAFADSWEEPSPPFGERHASYESADLEGQPKQLEGCEGLEFEPQISVAPTTNLSESPSGLDVKLDQRQDFTLGGRSTAALKDATLTLPQGLEVNASQADGLDVCSSTQIGMLSEVGQTPPHFAAQAPSCPKASKIGTLEATSPLLGQYDKSGAILQTDPETGEAIPEPLHGSVYVAKPFDNPFDALLAVYLAVEDPKTGTFATLASKVTPDPQTGQLTTTLTESPQLPVEGFKVHLFSGARAPLQTPPTCGTFTTTSRLVPWSSPFTPDATPSASFKTLAAPGGGACPSSAEQTPGAYKLLAGTLDPQAGAYSPLVAKLSREDGTQRMAKLEMSFPTGLTGKLAGIAPCSESDIAAARARSQPNEGALEAASPSCPADSEVGVLDVAAGSGPTPFYIQGHLYLAGPYEGAPLSFVAITPALAGPFDLGSVVVRIAAHLDPETAQVKVVSDPFPQILQGIPVDVRSVAVKTARSGFTLNPTSCEPKSFAGSVTTALSQGVPISDRFQVGGCKALRYRPELHTRLFGPVTRGGHPRLRVIFKAKPGQANTARVAFALPRSEFIDQAHFRTICTRVQFAASQCPAGAVYGHVRAVSPLVDYPLEGPIYLRSSSHELPDAVAVLRGPASQPIEVDLDGRVDSVNGGIRTTIETVPDAPVSKAIIVLQGAKKGLFQNSTNICRKTFRATAKFVAQNGAAATLRPKLRASCPKQGRAHRGDRR